MTQGTERGGSPVEEARISSITFGEFVNQEVRRLQSENKLSAHPQVRSHFFNLYSIKEGEHIPSLRASIRPEPGNTAPQTDLLLGVEKPILVRTSLHKGSRITRFSRLIPHVFNLTPRQLEDPNVTELLFLQPHKIPIAANLDTAVRIGGWVIDPQVRQRIREYAAADVQRVRKYWSLRNAPSVARTEARRGRFTIEDIVRSASGEQIPEGKIKFTIEDLEWLKAHMRALGLKVSTA